MIYQGTVLVRWKATIWINQSRAAVALFALLLVIAFTQFSQAGLVIVGKDGKAVEQPPSKHALVIGIADYDKLGKISNKTLSVSISSRACPKILRNAIRSSFPVKRAMSCLRSIPS